MPFLKGIERKYIDLNFGRKIGKDNVLQEIDGILMEFKKSFDPMTTWKDINESVRSGQTKSTIQNFDLKEIMENNAELKSAVERKLNLNNLVIVKDFIFKETFIKETLNEIRDRETKNLKDACEFLSIKKIPEKVPYRFTDFHWI